MVAILARSRWTSTSPKGKAFNWSRVRGIVCHYPAMGASVGVLSEAGETSRLRGWRNYHVGTLGWSDIGYNYAIGQSGRIYSLRGDRVGGHCYGHNSTTVGVLFIVGDNEPLTRAAQASFRALRTTLRQRGAGSGIWGHTEMSGNFTRCPGPYIMADIRSGILRQASAGATKPSTGSGASAPSAGGTSKPSAAWTTSPRVKAMSVAEVKAIQTELAGVGYDLGKYGIDGSYGDSTGNAVKSLQELLGLTADGVYGPGTEKALMALKDDIKKILAYAEQTHWRVDAKIPAQITAVEKKVDHGLAYGEQIHWRVDAKLPSQIAASQAAVISAIQESGKAQGLSDEQVQHIADAAAKAAAEAAAKLSAEDVASKLEVTTKEK